MVKSSFFSLGPTLYPILSHPSKNPDDILSAFDQLIQAGVKIVQLREKQLSGSQLSDVAHQLVSRARKHQVRLIINDDIILAAQVGADGVHLGQSDATVQEARQLGISIVGVSAHNVEQAQQAEAEGADYIGVGPIFQSKTKPQRPPIGLKKLKEIHEHVSIAITAIGGITESNAHECFAAGAHAVSMISTLFQSKNIQLTAQRLIGVC
jgi:thiamine-phosphate pyrophosphorylase